MCDCPAFGSSLTGTCRSVEREESPQQQYFAALPLGHRQLLALTGAAEPVAAADRVSFEICLITPRRNLLMSSRFLQPDLSGHSGCHSKGPSRRSEEEAASLLAGCEFSSRMSGTIQAAVHMSCKLAEDQCSRSEQEAPSLSQNSSSRKRQSKAGSCPCFPCPQHQHRSNSTPVERRVGPTTTQFQQSTFLA